MHSICNALMMITGVIEMFAICRWYTVLQKISQIITFCFINRWWPVCFRNFLINLNVFKTFHYFNVSYLEDESPSLWFCASSKHCIKMVSYRLQYVSILKLLTLSFNMWTFLWNSVITDVLYFFLLSHELVEQTSAVRSCPGKIGNHVQQHAAQDKRDECDMVLARQTHPLILKCATAIWDVSVADNSTLLWRIVRSDISKYMCEIFSFCEIKKFVEFQIKLINNEKQNVIRKFQGNT